MFDIGPASSARLPSFIRAAALLPLFGGQGPGLGLDLGSLVRVQSDALRARLGRDGASASLDRFQLWLVATGQAGRPLAGVEI